LASSFSSWLPCSSTSRSKWYRSSTPGWWSGWANTTASGTLGVDALEGSALSQSFNFAASTSLSFNWTLGTDVFDAGFADLAFVLVDGTLLLPLANVTAAELSGVFNYTFGAGAHTLAFGVVDINDYTGVSILTVSDVNLAAGAVPEPGSLALMLAGLGLLSLRAKRRN